MKKRFKYLALGLTALALFTAPSWAGQVILMTHDSFSISKPVMADFQKAVGAKLVILRSGDAGEALNKAILSKNNPMADIFYGVDNTFISRALDQDMFVPYAPRGLADLDPALGLDPENRLIPVDFGDVCLNYDIKWFKEKKRQPPMDISDLTRPEFKGLAVVQNPATSSPGLAFLLATVSRFGPEDYLAFWESLRKNDVLITNGWKEAYWGHFTAASKGDRPIVVSYASSPAAEVFYAKNPPDTPPTGVVLGSKNAFRQIEFAGILKNGKNQNLARKAMDFILSPRFQEDIPLQMFVFPANTRAVLPKVFRDHARITDRPAQLPPEQIRANRDKWIREWTELMLR